MAGDNGFSTLGKSYVERIETTIKAIEFEQEKAKEAIAPLREDIKEILIEAESNGLTKKAIRAVVKARALARKAEAVSDALEPSDKDTYDNIRHALGDLAGLPLGIIALDKASDRKTAAD